MTGILKLSQATDAARVRSLHAWSSETTEPPKAPLADPELISLQEERDALSRRLDERAAELEGVIARRDAMILAAETRGHRAGLAEAEDRSAALLAQVAAAIERALALFKRELESLERLAPVLAREGLDVIIGRSDARADLVADIIRHQLSGLTADAVIRIEVSRADFHDPAAFEKLASAREAGRFEILASDALQSGDCRIKLTLGALEVGVDQQWSRLSGLLTEMAEPREPLP